MSDPSPVGLTRQEALAVLRLLPESADVSRPSLNSALDKLRVLASGGSPPSHEWTKEGITEAIHAIANCERWTDGEWSDKAHRFRAALEGLPLSLPAEPSDEAIKAALLTRRQFEGEIGAATLMQAALRAAYRIDGEKS